MGETRGCCRWFVGNSAALFCAVTVILASSAFSSFCDEQTIQGIIARVQFDTNIVSAEGNCERYVSQFTNSPETVGRIYLALALNGEYVHNNDFSNIIVISKKALQYPLGVMDACSAYLNLADGLRMKMMSSGHAFSPRLNERGQTEMRKQILDVYLNALKLILSKATTLQKQEVPVVPMFDVGLAVISTNSMQTQEEREKIDAMNRTNVLWYQNALQENQAQWKAHDEAKAANDLVDRYNWFKRDVVDLYRGIPFVEEITAGAEKVAPGDSKMKTLAQELAEEVKQSNASLPTPETNLIK